MLSINTMLWWNGCSGTTGLCNVSMVPGLPFYLFGASDSATTLLTLTTYTFQQVENTLVIRDASHPCDSSALVNYYYALPPNVGTTLANAGRIGILCVPPDLTPAYTTNLCLLAYYPPGSTSATAPVLLNNNLAKSSNNPPLPSSPLPLSLSYDSATLQLSQLEASTPAEFFNTFGGYVFQLQIAPAPDLATCFLQTNHDVQAGSEGNGPYVLAETDYRGALACSKWITSSLAEAVFQQCKAPACCTAGTASSFGTCDAAAAHACPAQTPSSVLVALRGAAACGSTNISVDCMGSAAGTMCSGFKNNPTMAPCRFFTKLAQGGKAANDDTLGRQLCNNSASNPLAHAYECACLNALTSSFKWSFPQSGSAYTYQEFRAQYSSSVWDQSLGRFNSWTCWWPACIGANDVWQVQYDELHGCPANITNCTTFVENIDFKGKSDSVDLINKCGTSSSGGKKHSAKLANDAGGGGGDGGGGGGKYENRSHHKLSTPAIIGISVACGVVLVVAIVIGVVFGAKRSRRQQRTV